MVDLKLFVFRALMVASISHSRGWANANAGVAGTIDSMVEISLKCIDQLEPHDSGDPNPLATHRMRHPIFFGCLDWHASIFNHWSLLRAVNKNPELKQRTAIIEILTRRLTPANLKIELANLADDPRIDPFYGNAWLLRLAAEVRKSKLPEAKEWQRSFVPLEKRAVKMFSAWVERGHAEFERYLSGWADGNSHLYYLLWRDEYWPTHSIVHDNTAFSFINVLDYARTANNLKLEKKLLEYSKIYYVTTSPYVFGKFTCRESMGNGQQSWHGFFDRCLVQADLMRRTLKKREFEEWFSTVFAGIDESWLKPDETGLTGQYGNHKIAKMFFSATAMRGIAEKLGPDHANFSILIEAANRHVARANKALSEFQSEKPYSLLHWISASAMWAYTAVGSFTETSVSCEGDLI